MSGPENNPRCPFTWTFGAGETYHCTERVLGHAAAHRQGGSFVMVGCEHLYNPAYATQSARDRAFGLSTSAPTPRAETPAPQQSAQKRSLEPIFWLGVILGAAILGAADWAWSLVP